MDRVIQYVKPGQYIKMRVDGVIRKCCITEIFDYFVKARYLIAGNVYETSFNLGELVQAGYEPKGEYSGEKSDKSFSEKPTYHSNRSRYWRYGSHSPSGV